MGNTCSALEEAYGTSQGILACLISRIAVLTWELDRSSTLLVVEFYSDFPRDIRATASEDRPQHGIVID